MYSKTIDDIWFRSINLKDSTATFDGADDRPYYLGSGADKKVNPDFTNVFLLTNTDKGYRYFITASLTKKFNQNFEAFAAYTYGESKDVMNGVRNSMAANFNWNQSIVSNNPDVAYSNFDVRHRIVSSVGYTKNFGKNHKTSINIVYTGRSGLPFSYTVAGDVNRDGSSNNDLFYVPASSEEIMLKPIENSNGDVLVTAEQQWNELNSYIENDDYLSSKRGEYTERNGGRTPWNHLIDLRLAHKIDMARQDKPSAGQFEITLDVINVLNLINYNWGIQTFVPNVQNSSYQLIDFEGIENNVPTYQFNNPQGTPWQADALNSRWQAQIGLRYTF